MSAAAAAAALSAWSPCSGTQRRSLHPARPLGNWGGAKDDYDEKFPLGELFGLG